MINQQLVDYINQELKLGIDRKKIETDLVAAGWQSGDISDSFESLAPKKDSKSRSPKLKINFKKILIISGCVLIGLIFIGGIAYAYNAYFYSPEKNIGRMLGNLKNIKTMAYSGELNVSANVPATPISEKKLSKLSVSFNGASDTQNADDLRGAFSFQIKTDAMSGQEMSLGLEARSLSKTLFLKLSNLPNIGFIDLGFFNDKWIKLDESTIGQGGVASSSEKIDGNLIKEKAAKIQNLPSQDKFIKITETLKSEKIEGQDTYHYKYIIDKEALKKFISDYSTLIDDKALTAEQIASSSEQIDQIDLAEGEIWIGKSDFMPYKLSFAASTKDEKAINTNLVLSFKNFNQVIKIEEPTDVKTLTELIGGLMGGMFGGSGSNPLGDSTDTLNASSSFGFSNEDSKLMDVDSDGDGLNDYEEINVYTTHPNNPDTDGDGFSDRQEVKGGYNPLGTGKLIIASSTANLDILNTLEKARAKARDARRVADVKQIQTALEMYYNEMGFYPSVKEFASKSIKAGSSTFMTAIPEAPLPVDGTCLDKDGSNKYTYKTDSLGKTSSTYTLTYCIGNNVGSISAGINTASEKGIKQ